RQIDSTGGIGPDGRDRAPEISERKWRRRGELAGVKPAVNRGMFQRRIDAGGVQSLAAAKAEAGARGNAPVVHRRALRERQGRVHLPAAQSGVRRAVPFVT